MHSTRRNTRAPRLATALLAALVFCVTAARADRVTLYDGTVLDGTVIKQGDNYWVKTPDGKRKVIPVTDVKSLEKGSGPSVPAATPTAKPGAAAPKADAAEASPAASTSAKLDYAGTERKASSVDAPL